MWIGTDMTVSIHPHYFHCWRKNTQCNWLEQFAMISCGNDSVISSLLVECRASSMLQHSPWVLFLQTLSWSGSGKLAGKSENCRNDCTIFRSLWQPCAFTNMCIHYYLHVIDLICGYMMQPLLQLLQLGYWPKAVGGSCNWLRQRLHWRLHRVFLPIIYYQQLSSASILDVWQ